MNLLRRYRAAADGDAGDADGVSYAFGPDCRCPEHVIRRTSYEPDGLDNNNEIRKKKEKTDKRILAFFASTTSVLQQFS